MPAADPAAEGLVSFSVREGLEFLAPDNYLPTNPQLLEQTRREHGRNLVRGARHFVEDIRRSLKGLGPVGTESYKVGEQTATSKGKVILRNSLMELIQYSPTTEKVYRRARADRAGLDHEILHPRPVAEEFAGQVPHRHGSHGLHDFVEEPDCRGS